MTKQFRPLLAHTIEDTGAVMSLTSPSRVKDMTGFRSGSLTVLFFAGIDKSTGQASWACECDCGNTGTVLGANLRYGRSKSCGACANLDNLTGQTIQGLTVVTYLGRGRYSVKCECGNELSIGRNALLSRKTPGCDFKCPIHQAYMVKDRGYKYIYKSEYRIYRHMVKRCTDPADDAWPNYGGRGIYVCDRWLESFENFLADVGPRPSSSLSLDRVDNEGPYTPENVRWATRYQQAGNKRNNLTLPYGNTEIICAEDWCRKHNINSKTFWTRWARGWDIDRILSTPCGPYIKKIG